MFTRLHKLAFASLAVVSIVGGSVGGLQKNTAGKLRIQTVVNNQATGLYTDDFADATGLSATSNAGVDVASGMIKLKNAADGYVAPFNTSGYVITSTIIPTSVASWGTIILSATIPAGTTAKVQVMDEEHFVFSDSLLPGNSAGFSAVSPIDISFLSVTKVAGSAAETANCKFGRISLKIILTTTDTDVTPAVEDIAFTWTVNRGELDASLIASTSWSHANANSQATNRGSRDNSAVYPAIAWKKDNGVNFGGTILRGLGNSIYAKGVGGLTTWPNVYDGYLMALNKDTGAQLWNRPMSGNIYSSSGITLSDNGTIYASDIYMDMMLAFDEADGSLKWTYQFSGGHSDAEVAIGTDGSIYTIRYDNTTYLTVYAFDPDGSVKWTRTTVPAAPRFSAGPISVSADGIIYFSTTTYDAGNNYLNGGLLYALDPVDGSIEWTYPTGDSTLAPIVDTDGTIYVGNNMSYLNNKQITAINANGSLKWQYSIGSTTNQWLNLALRADGFLLADRITTSFPVNGGAVDVINTSDGSLDRSDLFNDDPVLTHVFMADASNGLYRTAIDYPGSAALKYYDPSGNNKWSFSVLGGAAPNYIAISYGAQDENGALYLNITKSGVYNSTVSLVPWTIVPSTSSSAVFRGDAITFTVASSMQATNPLTSEANKMQVVLDTGVVVPLTYSSTDSNGDTIWTGTYTTPADMSADLHRYTVQANAALVKTDIVTAFDAPATGTDNTGLISSAATFNVITRGGGSPPPSEGGNSNDQQPNSNENTNSQITNSNQNQNQNANIPLVTPGLVIPGRPAVYSVSPTELRIVIDQNGNTNGTRYFIQDAITGKFVQADGSLGDTAVFKTFIDWGGDDGVVAKVKPNTRYKFRVAARPSI